MLAAFSARMRTLVGVRYEAVISMMQLCIVLYTIVQAPKRVSHTPRHGRMAFVCPYCIEEVFTSPSEALLLNHIRLVHSCDPNFSIQCCKDGCLRTFNNFRTYQNHCRSHHEDNDADEGSMHPLASSEAVNVTMSSSSNTPTTVNDLQAFSAKWILKTSETRYLTQKASLGIVHDVSDLVEVVSQSLQDQVQAILHSIASIQLSLAK